MSCAKGIWTDFSTEFGNNQNARYYLWRVKRMIVFAVMQVDQNCINNIDVQWNPYILTNKKKKTVG
jgi:hypothetical protein